MIARPGSPKSEALRNLYWRSEVLRVMYWLRGEGLGDLVDVPLLRRFLGLGAADARRHLDELVGDGLLARDGRWYALSDQALQEEEEFATAFSEVLRPVVGACSSECWCQMSSEEADACASARGEPETKRKGTNA